MILGVYKYSLGVAFEEKSRKSRRNPVSTIESCEKERERILITFVIFISTFNIISPLLPVDIDTLAEPR